MITSESPSTSTSCSSEFVSSCAPRLAHHCFSLGDISLDAEAHRVERGGEEIRLTRKEFALLEYLLRNKGRLCRRTRIMEQVWDIHYEANTGVIDVYINALRKKLGLTQEDERIQTIRGVGYMAVEP